MKLFSKTLTAAVLPKPLSQPLPIYDEPTEEYKQLAAKLGVKSTLLTAEPTLESILHAEGIAVYPLPAVTEHMDKQTPKGKVWGWKPLREIDRKRCKREITFGFNSRNGRFMEGIYSKPIPFPVLLTIDKIETAALKIGIEPAFFVSDYCVPSPDPFLMVTIPAKGISQEQETSGDLWSALEGACFVVERWDEPSFRG